MKLDYKHLFLQMTLATGFMCVPQFLYSSVAYLSLLAVFLMALDTRCVKCILLCFPGSVFILLSVLLAFLKTLITGIWHPVSTRSCSHSAARKTHRNVSILLSFHRCLQLHNNPEPQSRFFFSWLLRVPVLPFLQYQQCQSL